MGHPWRRRAACALILSLTGRARAQVVEAPVVGPQAPFAFPVSPPVDAAPLILDITPTLSLPVTIGVAAIRAAGPFVVTAADPSAQNARLRELATRRAGLHVVSPALHVLRSGVAARAGDIPGATGDGDGSDRPGVSATNADAPREQRPTGYHPRQDPSRDLTWTELFDGAGTNRAEDPEAPADPPAIGPQPAAKDGLPGYLSTADPAHRAWLAAVVAESMKSRTGRRILKRVEKLSAERNRPVTIVMADIRGNNGEYVYDWDLIQMAEPYMKKEPAAAAATLVHELLHVLQKAEGLPTDALEMELEAHVVTLIATRELGLRFDKGSFYKSSDRKFHGDLKEYVEWLNNQYDENIRVLGSTMKEYQAEVDKRIAKSQRRVARIEGRLKATQKVLAEMRATNQPPRAIEIYEADKVGELQISLREAQLQLDWYLKDAAILRDPASRARYQAYARRVMQFVRRVHSRYGI